jgi:alkanesulfonate monooxygenase SsuD/methylene tetrahydromethanopterin reductase-like flavin-dependent oxidoreductase (luciferase family)
VRFGVLILPDRGWAAGEARWCRAEQLGFDHAWTYDHLAWRTLRDAAWFASVPTLTAAACVTRRIRLGTLVASPNFRHPVPFAKELMTLDDISAGRLTVGLGAGSDGWDAEVLGADRWSMHERFARFEEFTVMIDLLLRQSNTSHSGAFYSAREARGIPGCVQQPRVPFAIAATGPRGMRLAARYADVWVTTGDRNGSDTLRAVDGAAMVASQIAQLVVACERTGRDPGTIDRMVLTGPQLSPCMESSASFGDAIGRYGEVGVTDLVLHWPRSEDPYAGSLASFESVFLAASGSG